jgi:hypothetical protein
VKTISGINNFYARNGGKWWFLACNWVIAIIVTRILDTYIFLSPKDNPNMDITYCFIQTSPYHNTYTGKFIIKYQQEKDVNGIQIRIKNKGNKEAKHFEINFHVKTASVIVGHPLIIYKPTILSNRISDSLTSASQLYRKFEVIPCESEIFIQIMTSSSISEDSVTLEFLCDWRRWNPKPSEIKLDEPPTDKQSFKTGISWFLCAEGNESIKDTELIPLTLLDKPEEVERLKIGDRYKNLWESGGYDLGSILFWIYVKLEQHKITDSLYYERINDEGYIRIEGPNYSGHFLDILKYCEITLDLLIRKKIITVSEANSIIQNSREAGGTSIAGYNTLILVVGILDALLENNYISQKDGQRILETAKIDTKNQ